MDKRTNCALGIKAKDKDLIYRALVSKAEDYETGCKEYDRDNAASVRPKPTYYTAWQDQAKTLRAYAFALSKS